MNCGRCRVRLMLVVLDGQREVLTCPVCGEDQELPPPPPPPVELVVSVVWKEGRPTPVEVAALRRLFPEIRHVPAAQFWRMMRRLRRWESGVYFQSEALALERRGRALGLQIDLVPF